MSMIQNSTLQTSPERPRSADWPVFQHRLAEALDLLAEDQFLVISQKQGGRFIQFAGQGSFGLRAETVSNHFLKDDAQLTAEAQYTLLHLGWQSPSGNARASTPERDPDGSPNYFVQFPAGASTARIADLAVTTLADVLAVPYPGSLAYEAFDAEGNPLLIPVLGLKNAVARPQDRPLPEMLLHTVRTVTGIDDLAYDEDDDICLHYGEISIFITLLSEPDQVRICSPLVGKIVADAALLSRLNAINTKMPDMHCIVVGESVLAITTVPPQALLSSAFRDCLDRFAERAESIAIELRATVAGKSSLVTPQGERVLH